MFISLPPNKYCGKLRTSFQLIGYPIWVIRLGADHPANDDETDVKKSLTFVDFILSGMPVYCNIWPIVEY